MNSFLLIYKFIRLSLFVLTFIIVGSSFGQISKPINNTNDQNTIIDYSSLHNWAAIPLKKNFADSVPLFLKSEKRDTSVDVFYIHPTTFISNPFSAPWNADVFDEKLNDLTDQTAILSQATVFNQSCIVYAPRYRQAHLKVFFMKRNPKSINALDIAYSDIRAAFIYYINHFNHNRPIIIAGHSQGSGMAIRLLKEFFDNKPLYDRLICAYIPGADIKKNEFQNIPIGSHPSQTGCILTWRTYNEKANVEDKSSDNICINPISWTIDELKTNNNEHKGLLYPDFNSLLKNVVSARIDKSTAKLFVEVPEFLQVKLGKFNNYHIWDYRLFYMDIRENVRKRIISYQKKVNPSPL